MGSPVDIWITRGWPLLLKTCSEYIHKTKMTTALGGQGQRPWVRERFLEGCGLEQGLEEKAGRKLPSKGEEQAKSLRDYSV